MLPLEPQHQAHESTPLRQAMEHRSLGGSRPAGHLLRLLLMLWVLEPQRYDELPRVLPCETI
jgi:hypothetical protein